MVTGARSSADVQRPLRARVRSRTRPASAFRHHPSTRLPVPSRPRDPASRRFGTRQGRPGFHQIPRGAASCDWFASQLRRSRLACPSLACSNWAAASRQHLPTPPASTSPFGSHYRLLGDVDKPLEEWRASVLEDALEPRAPLRASNHRRRGRDPSARTPQPKPEFSPCDHWSQPLNDLLKHPWRRQP